MKWNVHCCVMESLISLCVNRASASARLSKDASRQTMCTLQTNYFEKKKYLFSSQCILDIFHGGMFVKLLVKGVFVSIVSVSRAVRLLTGVSEMACRRTHRIKSNKFHPRLDTPQTGQLLTSITHVNKLLPASWGLACLRLDHFLPGGGTQRSDGAPS